MNRRMKELPKEQRPYEKCLANGATVLSDSELLAVILRCGTRDTSSLALAGEILTQMKNTPYPGLLGLMHSSIQDLMGIKGIGKVKAVQLKCIGELSRRIALTAARPKICWDTPKTIAEYYMEKLRHEEQEQMYCMMLDTRTHLLGECIVSRGTVNSSLISPREIFLEALRYHAVGVVMIHNHPSGDPYPSRADYEITRRVCQAGEMLGISLMDHIVIGDQQYFSFAEEGLLTDQDPE